MTEKLCTAALAVILSLAAYGALKTVTGVVSMFNSKPAAIVAMHPDNFSQRHR